MTFRGKMETLLIIALALAFVFLLLNAKKSNSKVNQRRHRLVTKIKNRNR
jgi:hypothetical protein